MTSAQVHGHAELPPPALQEVSAGVFAYVQLDGSWGLNNTGFIVAGDSVLAIDTCFTERRSRWFKEAIERTAPGKPVKTLVNTHHHGDHTHGNWVFGPNVTIVGHERCRDEVIAAGHFTTALFPGVEWGEIRIAPPNLTFSDRLTLWADELRIELIYMGVAHTTNDIVAWLPDRGVLYTGDLVFNGGTPFVMMGSVAGSLEALARLKELGAKTLVPGHGPVCGPEAIEANEEYLRFVQDTARRGLEAGLSPLEAARETDLGRFADLLDRERLVGNLHRAYAELSGGERGAPLPLPAVVADMVAYNDGQMPRCLA
jgi:cyclase